MAINILGKIKDPTFNSLMMIYYTYCPRRISKEGYLYKRTRGKINDTYKTVHYIKDF